MDCPACERIEQYFFDTTTLWVAAALDHSIDKLVAIGGAVGADMERVNEYTLRMTLNRKGLNALSSRLSDAMQPKELSQLKVVGTADGEPPKVTDLARVFNGNNFLKRLNAEWLATSLSEERFETWFKPVLRVNADGQREPFGFEASFRVLDGQGSVLSSRDAFLAANDTDLLFKLDLTARRDAVQTAGAAKLQGKLFVGFHPASIYDPAYCLRSTAATVAEYGLSPEDIVFELDPSLGTTDEAHMLRIVDFYRGHNFGVALGRLDMAANATKMLNAVKPDYAALSPSLVRGVQGDFMRQAQVENLLDVIEMLDAKAVAVGVSSNEEVQWLHDAGVELFFGDLMGPASPATTYM